MLITDLNKIATDKLQKNVAEFIIYIYQMEDLCRVYEFNIEEIEKYVIHHFPLNDEEKKDMKKWFAWLINEMKEQDIEANGHISQVQDHVNEMLELKFSLLTEDEEFIELYNAARPHIREIIQDSNQTVPNDIQACLNGIYGLLLARMNGREVPEELTGPINTFGSVLSYLSYKYKQKYFLGSN